jgi:hypothetical protein
MSKSEQPLGKTFTNQALACLRASDIAWGMVSLSTVEDLLLRMLSRQSAAAQICANHAVPEQL